MTTRLLAVDQGSVACGLACFEGPDLVDVRVVIGRGRHWQARIDAITAGIRRLAAESDWTPDVIAIEDIVLHSSWTAASRPPSGYGQNVVPERPHGRRGAGPKTLVLMAQTRYALTSLFREIWPGARIVNVHPSRTKSAVGAPTGRVAAKAHTKRAFELISGWSGDVTEDEADAWSIGLAAIAQLRLERFRAMGSTGVSG